LLKQDVEDLLSLAIRDLQTVMQRIERKCDRTDDNLVDLYNYELYNYISATDEQLSRTVSQSVSIDIKIMNYTVYIMTKSVVYKKHEVLKQV